MEQARLSEYELRRLSWRLNLRPCSSLLFAPGQIASNCLSSPASFSLVVVSERDECSGDKCDMVTVTNNLSLYADGRGFEIRGFNPFCLQKPPLQSCIAVVAKRALAFFLVMLSQKGSISSTKWGETEAEPPGSGGKLSLGKSYR